MAAISLDTGRWHDARPEATHFRQHKVHLCHLQFPAARALSPLLCKSAELHSDSLLPVTLHGDRAGVHCVLRFEVLEKCHGL